MIKITKFGGSSLANAQQFQKVKHIIESDPSRRFVVVSAVGRANKHDNKVTDLLYLCQAHMQYHVDCSNVYEMIRQRYIQIRNDLHLHFPIERELDALWNQMKTAISVDELVSRGEYFTARLMAEYLGYAFVDAKDVIRFRYDGSIDYDFCEKSLQRLARNNQPFVMPGFYGSAPDGRIRVMTRGGSDITGSILAKCLHADLYENWTDVSGFLMADPRIVRNPRPIRKITYNELRELSYMGASVLHEDAIFPILDSNIPINILNTNDPDNPGTIIVSELDDDAQDDTIITGIAGKKDFSSISIYKNHMSESVGTVRKALSVFERYRVSIEHIPSGIDSFSVVVATKDIKDIIYDIVNDIRKELEPDQIKVSDEIALISTVGRNMSSHPGISGRIFATLGNNDINIRMIAQGSDEINIIVGVENKDFEKTIAAIYDAFIQEEEKQ
ncbi:aspartate kinase [Merdibacter massiliensis]|uniref:aspartate kinase n=1 Tax=Merdibacter massiliensis TaxID=1871030 RepID=UPI00096A2321|nr:aspartate kinase [Merdibacter massiliensis]